MTRDAFIEFLCEEQINFNIDYRPDGSSAIYVKGKPKEIVTFTGKIEMYTPYLRFSHFDGIPGKMYVRDNGLCDYRADVWCKEECIKYRDSFKNRSRQVVP